MKKKLIILLVLVIGGCQKPEDKETKIVKAFIWVESSNRNLKPYQDGKEQAFGLFGFHKDRYKELKGKNWGNATREEQIEAFRREMELVERKRGNVEFIRALCTYHNIGHITNKQTRYEEKIRKAMK